MSDDRCVLLLVIPFLYSPIDSMDFILIHVTYFLSLITRGVSTSLTFGSHDASMGEGREIKEIGFLLVIFSIRRSDTKWRGAGVRRS